MALLYLDRAAVPVLDHFESLFWIIHLLMFFFLLCFSLRLSSYDCCSSFRRDWCVNYQILCIYSIWFPMTESLASSSIPLQIVCVCVFFFSDYCICWPMPLFLLRSHFVSVVDFLRGFFYRLELVWMKNGLSQNYLDAREWIDMNTFWVLGFVFFKMVNEYKANHSVDSCARVSVVFFFWVLWVVNIRESAVG